jgi:hypothetical protein
VAGKAAAKHSGCRTSKRTFDASGCKGKPAFRTAEAAGYAADKNGAAAQWASENARNVASKVWAEIGTKVGTKVGTEIGTDAQKRSAAIKKRIEERTEQIGQEA